MILIDMASEDEGISGFVAIWIIDVCHSDLKLRVHEAILIILVIIRIFVRVQRLLYQYFMHKLYILLK